MSLFRGALVLIAADLAKVIDKRALPIAILFSVAGAVHLFAPAFFLSIVPSWVPSPKLAVALSGIAELAGAAGVLVNRTRVLAAWGLIALLVLVFPANVYMLQQAISHHASALWQALLWARLPLQPLLMWWVWRVGVTSSYARRKT